MADEAPRSTSNALSHLITNYNHSSLRQLALNVINYSIIMNNNVVGAEQPRSTSFHALLAFIVPVLLDFIEVKYQGASKTPFETHPLTIMIAIASLLVYCVAYGIELALSPDLSRADARICLAIMAVSGSFSLASLASILLPGVLQPALYVLFTLLLVRKLHGLSQILCHYIRQHHQLHARLARVAIFFSQWHLRRAAPILPITIADGHFLPPAWQLWRHSSRAQFT